MSGELPENQADPDAGAMQEFLEWLTRDWGQLESEVVVEISAIPPGGGRREQRSFPLDELPAAAAWAKERNASGKNAYVVVNPKQAEACDRVAKDKDIAAAFFHFVDLDEAGAVEQISEAPRSGTVTTGTIPHLRQHVYWRLVAPTIDMGAWRREQKRIAAACGGDKNCVNASRLMRLPGTISFPDAKKSGKGYARELVTAELGDGAYDMVPVHGSVAPENVDEHTDKDLDRRRLQPEKDRRLLDLLRSKRNTGLFNADDWSNLDDRSAWLSLIFGMRAAYSGTQWEGEAREAVMDFSARWEGAPRGVTKDELRRKAVEAWDRADPEGEVRAGTAQAILQGLPEREDLIFGEVQAPASFRLAPFAPTPLSKIPPIEYVYGSHYQRGELSITAAPGGTGKGLLAIGEAIAMATGMPLLAQEVFFRAKVLYLSGEETRRILDQRVNAALHHHDLGVGHIGDRLFSLSAEELRELIGAAPKLVGEGRDGPIVNEKLVGILIDLLRENAIDALIVDPLKKFHSVNENDNTAMDEVAAVLSRIARETNCSVEAVHHGTKESRKGVGSGHAAANASRGASSLIDAARSARVLEVMSSESAGQWHIDEPDQFVQIIDAKSNNAKKRPRGRGLWFEIRSVELGNENETYPRGDNVGVAVKWTPPYKSEAQEQEELRELVQALTELPDDKWRASDKSPDWVGYELARALEIDIGEGLKATERTSSQSGARSELLRGLAKLKQFGILTVERSKSKNGSETPWYVLDRARTDRFLRPLEGVDLPEIVKGQH